MANKTNTPSHFLEKLSNDEHVYVSHAGLNTPNITSELKTFMVMKY